MHTIHAHIVATWLVECGMHRNDWRLTVGFKMSILSSLKITSVMPSKVKEKDKLATARSRLIMNLDIQKQLIAVSYTHLTLPTKRIV